MFLTKKRLRLYLGALLVLQIAAFLGCFHLVRDGYIDFRTFYTAGHMVRSGDAARLYDYDAEQRAQSAMVSPNVYALPFMYPAYASLIFVPLAWSSYRAAYLLFFAGNLLLSRLALAIMRPYSASLSARWKPLLALIFLSFMPIGIALIYGQVSILLLLLYCACFAALQNDKPFIAGLFLSLALIKFQIALPVALLFLIWRRWRFVAGFAGGAVALSLVSVYLTGIRVLTTYWHSVFLSSHASTAASQAKYAMFPAQMPNLYGFYHSIAGGAPWGQALTIACSLLVLVWAMFQRPSLPLALLAGLLVSYHLYLYDLSLLFLPITLIFNERLAPSTSAHLCETSQFDSTRFARWRTNGAIYAATFLVIAPIGRFLGSADLTCLFAIPVAILLACLNQIGAAPSSNFPARLANGVEREQVASLAWMRIRRDSDTSFSKLNRNKPEG